MTLTPIEHRAHLSAPPPHMTNHRTRLGLAAVLIGISALAPSTRRLAQLPLDQLRAQAGQGRVRSQWLLGTIYAEERGVPPVNSGPGSTATTIIAFPVR